MVSIVSSHTVIPCESTPNGILGFSESDQINSYNHALTIYVYRPEHSHNVSIPHVIDTMRHSLGKSLVHYYPLAGRLHWMKGGRMELDCNAMGVTLLEAESTKALDEYGEFEPNDTIRELIPKVDYGKPIEEVPLLLVQLTRFSCGGLSIGVAISNAMVDGVAGTSFINSWAKLARRETLEEDELPFLDRSILNEVPLTLPLFDHTEFKPPPLMLGCSDHMFQLKKETALAILKLTREEVDQLKKKANEFMMNDKILVPSRPYSRFESIAAHIWKSASKARHLDNNQPTIVRFVADIRNRLKPPLPPNYFGNAILPTVTPTCLSGDIISNPLSYGAQRIREAIEVLTEEYVRSELGFIGSKKNLDWLRPSFNSEGCVEAPFLGNPNLNIWSWISKMPIYGPDFGWGRPVYMGPGSVNGDGRAFIMPGRAGDGSLTIAIRLQIAHMEAFKKFFNEDIKDA